MPPRSMIFGACSAARPALGPSGCPPDCPSDCPTRHLIRLYGGSDRTAAAVESGASPIPTNATPQRKRKQGKSKAQGKRDEAGEDARR